MENRTDNKFLVYNPYDSIPLDSNEELKQDASDKLKS